MTERDRARSGQRRGQEEQTHLLRMLRKGRFGPEWEGEEARVAAGAPTVSTPPSAFCSRRPAF